MSQRLPSTFLEISKEVKNQFWSASKGIANDISMHMQIASDLHLQNLAEKYPRSAACIRPRYAGFEMSIKFMNPYAKIGMAIPLIGIAGFNPLPGDFSVGVILISSSVPQIKADMRALKGRFNGDHKKLQFQAAREIAAMLNDKTNSQKHLVLEAMPS